MAKWCLQVNRPRMSGSIGRRKPGIARERRVARALSPELAFSSESKREMTGVEELLSAVAMWGGPQGFKVRGQEGRVVWP